MSELTVRKPDGAGEPGTWFVRFKEVPEAKVRLYLFNHAGAGANAFFPWASALAPEVEVWGVQLPGREGRFAEPFLLDLEEAVLELADAFERAPPPSHQRWAFFGHSMGSQLAFELARELRGRGLGEPVHLGVAARVAPHLPLPDPPDVMTCPEEELLAFLDRHYGGFPSALRESPELRAAFLPQLRADLAMLFSYAYVEESKLSCAMTAYSGEEDVGVSAQGVAQWGHHTGGPYAHRTVPGDHFFIHSARESFLEVYRRDLLGRNEEAPR